jgi:hypothetical protein
VGRTSPKRRADAISARDDAIAAELAAEGLPEPVKPRVEAAPKRRPGRKPLHKAAPTEPAARAAYTAQQFRTTVERETAAEKRRANPKHESHAALAERRDRTQYSLSQLDPEQVAAIETDYRAGLKPVEAICTEHRIHRSTLYALAERRSWPLRSEIQRAMAEAVQESLVQSLAVDLRHAVNGAAGVDQPASIDAINRNGLDGDIGAEIPASGQLLDPDDPQEPLTERMLNDMARQDLLVEQYSIAVALVLKGHRRMAKQAVDACGELIDINRQAITAAKARALELLQNPKELAAYLEPLAKSLSATVKTMREAIDLQRQALAMDSTAGKGMALADLARVRAVQAGMAGADALKPSPSDGGQVDGAPDEGAAGDVIPLPADVGGYEALVREAEARGVALA